MPKIKIVSDSTCDLSPELLKKYDVEIVSLYINLGGKILKDVVEITPKDIYEYVDKNKILPGTIASTVEDFKQVFQKWVSQGYQVICHTISSDMSCSCQNARIAAEEVGGVWVVDSRNLSSGVGHVVVNSAIMAQSGMEAPEIVKQLENLIPRVRASFILDNLDYMKKGGRCSSVAVLGANLLKIKPTILVENGNMKVGHKFRGPLKKVIEEYVDMQLEGRSDIIPDRIFITHTGCDREIVEMVRERIKKHIDFKEILETFAGCTVTSHCGPNTLGVLFIVK